MSNPRLGHVSRLPVALPPYRLPAWVIVIGSVFFSLCLAGYHYLELHQAFKQTRAESHHQDQLLLADLEQTTVRHLEQLHSLIASSGNPQPTTSPASGEQASGTLPSERWEEMQYHWNLEFVGYYSATDNQLINHWAARPIKDIQQQTLQTWVSSVEELQRGMTFVDCIGQCSLFLVAPINADEGVGSTLVIGVSLTGMINRFHQITGKTAGILTPAADPDTSTDTLVYRWGLELFTLIGDSGQAAILQSISETYKPGESQQQHINYVSEDDQHYELNLYALPHAHTGYFVVLENLTGAYRNLRFNTLELLASSFILSLVLLFILSLIIRTKRPTISPAALLDQTELTLPQRETPNPSSPAPSEPTQFDTQTPIDFLLSMDDVQPISEQLDQLKKFNTDINEELVKQMLTLGKERDRFKTIIDHIQTIIITLDRKGRITSANRYAEALTGYDQEELIGKTFIDLYPENQPYSLNDMHTMSAVAGGEQESFRHEARLKCRDGKERIVLWLHACLAKGSRSRVLSTGLDITESKQLEKNLSWLADHDSLTALYNRRRFEKELEEALAWASTHDTDGALLYIDLDNFKDINDSCGHQVGDTILRKVASSLTNITQDVDDSAHLICARLGGDEFAILLRNIDEAGVSILSNRILDKLYQIRHQKDDFQFQLSCSIGIAQFPSTENTVNEMFSNADYAMYQAKMLGRNQYYLFKETDSQREQINQRLLWKKKIEDALEKDRFVLHFQPILDIQKRTISHYETLIRMLDDDGELISPGSFINISERLGLIKDIDHFILDSAIGKQAELLRQGHDITLAINLSGKAFDDPALVDIIRDRIATHGARAENLIFEITETAAVSDIVAAEKIMQEIQSLGCQFALDDFGVGFSSFYYLRELPVEYVKIDGSFVNDLPSNTDNRVLVNALSEVAIGFNKLSVAEFVDSLQTLRILDEAKVNYAQGFFIGKPSEKIPVDPPRFHTSASHSRSALM